MSQRVSSCIHTRSRTKSLKQLCRLTFAFLLLGKISAMTNTHLAVIPFARLASPSARATRGYDSIIPSYSLFEPRLKGGAQPPEVWYAENAQPSYACADTQRIGPQGDGGKWICNPRRLRARCLVYSIGSYNDYGFEEAILKDITKDCEVHVFDHTVEDPSPPPNVYFHPWGLAAVDDGPMKSLRDIVDLLGHNGRTINIFKIDCEGCEWRTFRSWFEAGVLFEQILIEVHAGTTRPAENPVAKQFMQTMFNNDMMIFHKEPNELTAGDRFCVEYSFTRVPKRPQAGDWFE